MISDVHYHCDQTIAFLTFYDWSAAAFIKALLYNSSKVFIFFLSLNYYLSFI